MQNRITKTIITMFISIVFSLLLYSDLQCNLYIASGFAIITAICSFLYDRSQKAKTNDEVKILIQQDQSPLKDNLKKLITPYLIGFTLVTATLVITKISITGYYLIISILPLLVLQIASKTYGDFYITKEGFVQTDSYKELYHWNEIYNLNITDSRLLFSLKDKDYNIEISNTQSRQLQNLIKDLK